jgi:acyl carrier protein
MVRRDELVTGVGIGSLREEERDMTRDMTPVQPTAPEARPMIADADVASRVREITARVLGIAQDRVAEPANFVTDLGASSLDLVELIMAIEDGFGIEISDSAAEKITTVGDLLAFIRSQLPAARAA